jgi:hypothetical protein
MRWFSTAQSYEGKPTVSIACYVSSLHGWNLRGPDFGSAQRPPVLDATKPFLRYHPSQFVGTDPPAVAIDVTRTRRIPRETT